VASPCSMPWNAMAGTDLVRHCGECRLNVYNLSAMTEVEIQHLLGERDGQRVCVRFYRRADGTMLTQDCPRGLKRLTRRVSMLCAAVLSAIVSVNYAAAKTRPRQNACSRVQAHETFANMSITITDPDGAVIPGAKIVLLDHAGKTRFSGRSNGAGSLTSNDLKPGDYTLKVAVRGFKEYSDALRLEESKNVQVNLKLALAATSTTVEVVSSPVEVQGTVGILVPAAVPNLPATPNHSQPAPMRQ